MEDYLRILDAIMVHYLMVGVGYCKVMVMIIIIIIIGYKGLFKGGLITVLRAVVLNASLTGPYDYLREKLWITFGDYGFLDFVSTAWAAFWGTLVVLPIDNMRTRWLRAFNDTSRNRL